MMKRDAMAIEPSQAQAIFDQLREIDRRSTRVEVQTETLLRGLAEISGKLDARSRPCPDFSQHIKEHAAEATEISKNRRTVVNTVLGGVILSSLLLIAGGLLYAIKAGWLVR
jgi:hypothetical protein